MKPWHDTGDHDCGNGKTGPIVPFYEGRPFDVHEPRHVRCVSCGDDWLEEDLRKLVQVYWSAGTYVGSETQP